MSHCSACGQQVESTATFCQHCGHAIVRGSPRPSDWSEPIEGVGCASSLLALCAILCGLGAACCFVLTPVGLIEAPGLGILTAILLPLLAGLTIVFVRVLALGFRDDQSRR